MYPFPFVTMNYSRFQKNIRTQGHPAFTEQRVVKRRVPLLSPGLSISSLSRWHSGPARFFFFFFVSSYSMWARWFLASWLAIALLKGDGIAGSCGKDNICGSRERFAVDSGFSLQLPTHLPTAPAGPPALQHCTGSMSVLRWPCVTIGMLLVENSCPRNRVMDATNDERSILERDVSNL